MNPNISLNTLLAALAASGGTPAQPLALSALLNLGIIESLANRLLSATNALRVFFHPENCLFVRTQLREKTADALMSHGVQLQDLFDELLKEEAHREFQRELATRRALCLKHLEEKQVVT